MRESPNGRVPLQDARRRPAGLGLPARLPVRFPCWGARRGRARRRKASTASKRARHLRRERHRATLAMLARGAGTGGVARHGAEAARVRGRRRRDAHRPRFFGWGRWPPSRRRPAGGRSGRDRSRQSPCARRAPARDRGAAEGTLVHVAAAGAWGRQRAASARAATSCCRTTAYRGARGAGVSAGGIDA